MVAIAITRPLRPASLLSWRATRTPKPSWRAESDLISGLDGQMVCRLDRE